MRWFAVLFPCQNVHRGIQSPSLRVTRAQRGSFHVMLLLPKCTAHRNDPTAAYVLDVWMFSVMYAMPHSVSLSKHFPTWMKVCSSSCEYLATKKSSKFRHFCLDPHEVDTVYGNTIYESTFQTKTCSEVSDIIKKWLLLMKMLPLWIWLTLIDLHSCRLS